MIDPTELLQEAMIEVAPRIMEIVGRCELIVMGLQDNKLFCVNSGLSNETTIAMLEASIAQIKQEMSEND